MNKHYNLPSKSGKQYRMWPKIGNAGSKVASFLANVNICLFLNWYQHQTDTKGSITRLSVTCMLEMVEIILEYEKAMFVNNVIK